jgi:hypothetical protein
MKKILILTMIATTIYATEYKDFKEEFLNDNISFLKELMTAKKCLVKSDTLITAQKCINSYDDISKIVSWRKKDKTKKLKKIDISIKKVKEMNVCLKNNDKEEDFLKCNK